MMTSGMTDAFATALNTIQGDATGMISTAMPYALAIAGAVLVVRIGWKAFKSFTGK